MPGAVAGRDRPAVGPEGRPSSRQRLEARVGTRVLVAVDDDGLALPLRDRDRHDLVGEPAGLDGRDGALLALEREGVLALARDAPALGDVLGGLAHRVRVVALGQPRVDEAPAEGRVGHLARAAIPGALGLELDVRRAGHRFDAAADEHVAVADRDRVGGRVDRLEPGAAQPVDGQPADLDREVGQEQGHPRDVAVVLAGLVGAAEDDVLDERRDRARPGRRPRAARPRRGRPAGPTPGRRRSGRSASGRPRRSRPRAAAGAVSGHAPIVARRWTRDPSRDGDLPVGLPPARSLISARLDDHELRAVRRPPVHRHRHGPVSDPFVTDDGVGRVRVVEGDPPRPELRPGRRRGPGTRRADTVPDARRPARMRTPRSCRRESLRPPPRAGAARRGRRNRTCRRHPGTMRRRHCRGSASRHRSASVGAPRAPGRRVGDPLRRWRRMTVTPLWYLRTASATATADGDEVMSTADGIAVGATRLAVAAASFGGEVLGATTAESTQAVAINPVRTSATARRNTRLTGSRPGPR